MPGLDTLIEKPVAESAEETRQLAAAAEASGARFRPGHNFLGLPSYERLKAMVTAGDLGRIAAAEIISHFGARPETSLRELAEARLGHKLG